MIFLYKNVAKVTPCRRSVLLSRIRIRVENHFFETIYGVFLKIFLSFRN